MNTTFTDFSPEARIWIYPSSRAFSPAEEQELQSLVAQYLNQWNSHGTPLKSAFEIRHHRFLVILLEDNQHIGGCSLDDLARFIQELEKRFGVSLLDRMNVCFWEGEHIVYQPLADFKKMAKQKKISPELIVFNNLVNNLYEYQNHWEVPARESWHSRFF